jgi:hypothetical protein
MQQARTHLFCHSLNCSTDHRLVAYAESPRPGLRSGTELKAREQTAYWLSADGEEFDRSMRVVMPIHNWSASVAVRVGGRVVGMADGHSS